MDREAGEAEAQRAVTFVAGLVEAFGLRGDTTAKLGEDDIEVAVTGADLGLLVGPRGQTLQAVQELTRSVAQRNNQRASSRLTVDIAGYRERRRQALTRFATQIAGEVLSTGSQRALEPMSSVDRKIVHDTVQGISGVVSLSEGEDPRRYVLIRPEG